MKLYLVQHGQAKSKGEDPDRPLNEEGIRNAEKVATWMAQTDEKVSEILHSGKMRAEQTANIFGRQLSPSKGVIPASGLNPKDDILPIVEMLNKQQDPLMIVGHLPFLSLLVDYLVTGDQHSEVVKFQNAGVVCLSKDQGQWSIEWVVTPSLLK